MLCHFFKAELFLSVTPLMRYINSRRGISAAARSLAVVLLVAAPAVLWAQNPIPVPPPNPTPAAPKPVTPTTGLPATPTEKTAAQEAAEARLGRPVSNQQIVDIIRRSGMTQQEIKSRLQASGYNASLADPFFVPEAAAGGANAPSAAQTASFVDALTALGMITSGEEADKERTDEDTEPEKANREAPAFQSGGVFGKALFGKTSGIFQPTSVGPIDQSYRLGPGDQVQVILTGGVELAYTMDVRKDGSIMVPQVGQVQIAGLTLESARSVFRGRAAQSFAGINTGRIQVDLTVAKVRTNQVFVIGEVESPGAYQVSALATAFHAIARAGGPTSRGSFRSIEVRRGSTVVKRLDLYDYLVSGDISSDIRTEQGDVIFVPLNTRSIGLVGAVRRPSVFELVGTEGFSELLRFSGGLLPTAATDRVQIDRILPPDQREPGKDRVVIDIMVKGNLDSLARVPLFDGDVAQVFTIGNLRRGKLAVAGEVFQPGTFEITPGLTLGALLEKAQGVLPWAARDRVKVLRTMVDGKSELISVDITKPEGLATPLVEFDEVRVLDSRPVNLGPLAVSGAVRKPFSTPAAENVTLRDAIDLAGGFLEYSMTDRIKIQRPILETGRSELMSVDFNSPAGQAFALKGGDKVTILDGRTIYPSGEVSMAGAVVQPGKHAFIEHQTLQDLIDASGGFLEEAIDVEVARRRVGANYSDTTSIVSRFSLVGSLLAPEGRQFVLQRDDRVLVRGAPGFRQQKFAEVAGMFRYPAAYAITENTDRVADLIARAGGTLPGAYLRSGRLLRGGRVVAIDFEKAIRKDQGNNVLLFSGDLLTLSNDPGTVFVTGEVQRPALVKYDRSLSLKDYIERAGGLAPNADYDNLTVEDPSGLVQRTHRVGYLFASAPAVHSGAIINVPPKPESKSSFRDTMTTIVQTASALASLAIAYLAVRK